MHLYPVSYFRDTTGTRYVNSQHVTSPTCAYALRARMQRKSSVSLSHSYANAMIMLTLPLHSLQYCIIISTPTTVHQGMQEPWLSFLLALLGCFSIAFSGLVWMG